MSDPAERGADSSEALERAEREHASACAAAQRERLRVVELEAAQEALEAIAARTEEELEEARCRVARLTTENQHLRTAHERVIELERTVAELRAELAGSRHRREAGSLPRGGTPAVSFIGHLGDFPLLDAATLEIARRRLAKLRRDPRLFLAHSRFAAARKLARLLDR